MPGPYGYDDDGNCSNCGSEDQALSSPYHDDERGAEIQDVYCERCGAVLEYQEA